MVSLNIIRYYDIWLELLSKEDIEKSKNYIKMLNNHLENNSDLEDFDSSILYSLVTIDNFKK